MPNAALEIASLIITNYDCKTPFIPTVAGGVPGVGVLLHADLGQRAPLGRRRRRDGPRGRRRPLGRLLPHPHRRGCHGVRSGGMDFDMTSKI